MSQIRLHQTYYRSVDGLIQTAIPYGRREGKYACHWNGKRVLILAYVLQTEYFTTLGDALVEEIEIDAASGTGAAWRAKKNLLGTADTKATQTQLEPNMQGT